jgi:epsilon-lactone hydrolase
MSDEMDRILELLAAAPSNDGEPVEKRREDMDALAGAAPMIEGTVVEPVSAGGVRAEWLRPPGSVEDAALVYLHGGGYCIGSLVSHKPMAAKIGAAAGLSVLLVDYRLGPEHCFPAAVEDASTVLDWLLEQGFARDRVALAGDSAGGGLTLATLVARRDAGVTLPGAAACLSPWTDLTQGSASMDANEGTDPMLDRARLQNYAEWYLGPDGDPTHPHASPRFADFHGLPPVLLHVAADEVLLDDARLVAEGIEAAGGTVEYRAWPGVFHVWHAVAGLAPEADDAVAEVGAFIRRHLNV